MSMSCFLCSQAIAHNEWTACWDCSLVYHRKFCMRQHLFMWNTRCRKPKDPFCSRCLENLDHALNVNCNACHALLCLGCSFRCYGRLAQCAWKWCETCIERHYEICMPLRASPHGGGSDDGGEQDSEVQSEDPFCSRCLANLDDDLNFNCNTCHALLCLGCSFRCYQRIAQCTGKWCETCIEQHYEICVPLSASSDGEGRDVGGERDSEVQ